MAEPGLVAFYDIWPGNGAVYSYNSRACTGHLMCRQLHKDADDGDPAGSHGDRHQCYGVELDGLKKSLAILMAIFPGEPGLAGFWS